jgi:hypothetical protein
MTLVTEVRLDALEHLGLTLMARMTVQTGKLLLVTLESHAREETVFIMRVDGMRSEQFLAVMAFAAEGVLLCFRELVDPGRNVCLGVLRVGRCSGMAGLAFTKLRDGDAGHALLTAVSVFLPGIILALVAALADRRGRNG